ncbi:MAG: peptidoglycan DD-metalloendopeptidase family protein [Nitrosomonadales bacterium]
MNLRIKFIFLSLLLLSKLCLADLKENEKNLNDVQQEIKKLEKQLLEQETNKKNVTQDLKTQEKKISQTKKEIISIENKLSKHKNKLSNLQNEEDKISKEISIQKESLVKYLINLHKNGEASYLELILSGDNPNKISREYKLLSYFTNSQLEQIKLLQENQQKLLETQSAIKNTIGKVEDLKNTKSITAKQLELEKAEKKDVLNQINLSIKDNKTKKNKLIEDERKLTAIIDELLKKSDEEIKAKKTAKKDLNKDEKVMPFAGKGFASLKGKLSSPVQGTIQYQFGAKRKDTGVTWKGLFYKTNEGKEVKAIADGKVAYADWLRGFGNLIILDHGEGYMSLYGYNESVLPNVNDIVKMGDQIATSGDTGGLGLTGLYFELRKNSVPFDPAKWIK